MADHWEDDEDVPTALVKDDDDDAPDDWEAELEKKVWPLPSRLPSID